MASLNYITRRVLVVGDSGSHDVTNGVRIVDTIDSTGDGLVHAAAYIHRPHSASVAAITECGKAFGATDGWMAGRMADFEVDCAECRKEMG